MFPAVLSTASKKEAQLDTRRLLLAFKKQITPKEVSSAVKELNLELEDANEQKEKSNKRWNQVNHTVNRFWVKTTDGSSISDKEYQMILKRLESKIDWIGPVYSSSPNSSITKFCPLPNVILIEKNEKLRKRQDDLIKRNKLSEVAVKSKYLRGLRYLTILNVRETNAYILRSILQESSAIFGAVRFETMPMIRPSSATIPNDTFWADQWNMTQINAPNAWDISTGSNAVVICILDQGCDLIHPDLQFSGDGINLGTMMPTGAPTGPHGTACAGIAAATFNNNEGVAGLAGDCLIMPVAFSAWTDVEVANGLNYATTNGARVISMSFGWDPWDSAIIDPEIQNAFDNDVVMCVATHNHSGAITYPATNPLVMAIGASEQTDNKADFSDWGDVVYGGVLTGVSVVAPGVLVPTTDQQGGDGYEPGDYRMDFDGTSAATPHVAGFSALIRSQYPALTNIEVRNIIERTAARVGGLAYAEMAGFPNGTRNEEMGYGRIDVFQGLDFADMMIKDWAGDDGREPSTPPSNNWWSYSDIVVRITDDNVFDPADPAKSKHVERGQTNYIYVRVTNNGPRDARNVVVDFRITPYVGLQFVYPNDWTLDDGMHVRPTPVSATFPNILAGTSVIAKFTISAAQTETLYGWQYVNPWHPCLLALVTSDNDYAFASSDLSFGNLVLRKNNIAQRNLSVIDVLANAAAMAVSSPFVAGNRANKQSKMFIEIDRTKLPLKSKVFLSLDDDGSAFPLVDFHLQNTNQNENESFDSVLCKGGSLTFLSKAKIKTRFGCCDSLLTLEKGSVLEFPCTKEKVTIHNIKGGSLEMKNGRRVVEMTTTRLLVELEKLPGQILPISVRVLLPPGLTKGEQYTLSVSQRDESHKTVGGADAVYIVV